MGWSQELFTGGRRAVGRSLNFSPSQREVSGRLKKSCLNFEILLELQR